MYIKQEGMMQMTFTKLPKSITAEELLSTPLPPVKWIIPGLLPAGLALFAGPSKAGKSWLTLWLCLQIAQGNPVWNREIEPRTVIYFSLEDTFNRLQNRIFQLIDGGDAPERLILQTECPSIGQGLEEQVESLIHTYRDVGLVVIDTLQKVRVSDGNGGMYANDYKEAGALKKLADKYGICILLIQNEPILYRAYYTLAITTGLRRGELCALQWRDITGACELTVRRSRSCASGQIVESDTKSHRERIVTIPMGIWELLMALRQQQVLHSGVPDREQPIFTDPDGHVPHPDSFTRHLRKLYKKCGLSEDYHLHTLRHFYATYLLQEGTSKQVAASLLGHADTAFLERTYCHPQDVAKQQAANLMQDLLNSQNPCYVAFMKNKNRKAKKAG